MGIQSTMCETQANYDRIDELKAFDEEKTGVKGLIDAGIKSVPSIFIRSPEDRSKDFGTCPENISVPVIDFARVGQNNERTKQIAEEIVSASKNWGFFQVINHGIPLELLEKMIEANKLFHEQDVETKKKFYTRDYFSKRVGFLSNHDLYAAKAANWRDTLYVNTMAGELNLEDLPIICKDVTMEYINQILMFNQRILRLFSMGLGLDPECLGNLETDKGWSLACHYYPACPEPELTLGNRGHTDSSFLTMVLQDQIGGLQILRDNQWVNVEPITGALIINIGDALQMVTNDQLKSVNHRVIAKDVGPRASVPFFFHGSVLSEKIYGPIKELTSQEYPPIYKDFTTKELLSYFATKPVDELVTDYFKLHDSKDGN